MPRLSYAPVSTCPVLPVPQGPVWKPSPSCNSELLSISLLLCFWHPRRQLNEVQQPSPERYGQCLAIQIDLSSNTHDDDRTELKEMPVKKGNWMKMIRLQILFPFLPPQICEDGGGGRMTEMEMKSNGAVKPKVHQWTSLQETSGIQKQIWHRRAEESRAVQKRRTAGKPRTWTVPRKAPEGAVGRLPLTQLDHLALSSLGPGSKWRQQLPGQRPECGHWAQGDPRNLNEL